MNTALAAVKQMTCPTIDPEDVASVLGCTAHSLRVAARQRPELLGFPVIVMGHRVRIPRLPFIQFLEGGGCIGDRGSGQAG